VARRQLSHRNEGSATIGPTRTRIPQQGLAAACLAVVAFLCYYRTLVPGLDLGDSASFQTGLGSLTLTPRHAYPLYHGLGSVFVWLHPGEPARAANLASAVFGALAVSAAALFATRLSESAVAGMTAGLFLAFSYTFWSQATTAEVYTLHVLVMGAAGLALLAWADRPSVGRLALFYAAVALGFGNHLSMVLLLPAFTLFLLMCRRPGAGDPLRPRLVLMAVAIAALGALQYAWNFRGLWTELEPPASIGEAVRKFWFDVTKADWRETLVMTVSETGLESRPAMYWFDLRQQFGVPGVILAAIGFFYVLLRWPRRAILLLALYAANLAFAWTYNVGDAYIFFLPSHYAVALSAGAGTAAIAALAARFSNRSIATAAVVLLLLYPVWRGYDTLPALDRSGDTRAVQLLDEFVQGIDDFPTRQQDAVLGLDANWQVQNAVEYYMRERKPELVWFVTEQLEWLEEGDRLRQFGGLVAANANIGRSTIVTERVLDAVYRPSPRPVSLHVEPHLTHFSERIESIRPGTPYALAVLRSDREFMLNSIGLANAWQWLAPGVMPLALRHHYTVVVGRVGERPVLIESQDRPYRIRVRVEPYDFDVRMESWLPTDTIRRAGFGHVVVNRQHVLTLERGLSFVALGPGGGPVYGSGLFAPLARHLVRPQSLIPNPTP
jgi:Protein of unknown function (DUF2723)